MAWQGCVQSGRCHSQKRVSLGYWINTGGFLASRQIARRVVDKPQSVIICGGPLHSVSKGWQATMSGAAQVLGSSVRLFALSLLFSHVIFWVCPMYS